MKNTKVVEGDLILEEDFKHDGDLKVEGNIICEEGRWNIEAGNIEAGNIEARNIDAWDINAWNINAWNIDAWNIDAGNIEARNIDAGNIICEKRIKKNPENKTFARIFITERSKLKRKEWIEELDNKQVSNLRNVSFKVKVLEVAK